MKCPLLLLFESFSWTTHIVLCCDDILGNIFTYLHIWNIFKLEQLGRLRSEDTPRRLMITHTIESYWIPSQKNYRSRTENVTERIQFSKSRSNDLADIGQGQRSSHATHLLMLVIICTKYGKNPPRTVDATKRTRFSRSRPNDLENIGQRSKVITCDTPSDANDDLCQIWNFRILL